jgi:uncharacterized protein (DUF433 family)/DNA-binding transcriptional MerR regulator
MEAAAQPRGWYLAREVGLLAGVSGDRVGQWARYGYIRSTWSDAIPRVYSFQDVAEAIAVHELLQRGVPHIDIRRAIEGLRDEFGDWPLQVAPLVTTERPASARIARQNEGLAFDVGRQRGQTFLSFIELQGITDLLRRGGWALRELPDVTRIEVDPDRLSGRPTIRDRRVPAEKVARIAAMPGGLRILRSGYDVTKREADDAVRWYQRAQQISARAA